LFRTAYDGLLEAIKNAPQFSGTPTVTKIDVPRHKAGDPIPPLLTNVKYWKRSEYLEAKRKGKNATGVKGRAKENRDSNANTMTWYVTDEHGAAVGAAEVEFMRERARAGWWLLLHLGLAPITWCKITVDASDIWEFYMVSRFVKLTFGEENWKAHMIATDNYPSWALTRKKEGYTFSGPLIPQGVKLEPIDMTVDAPLTTSTTPPSNPSKRRLSSTLGRETAGQKRPRAIEPRPHNATDPDSPIPPSTAQVTQTAAPNSDNAAPGSIALETGVSGTTEVDKAGGTLTLQKAHPIAGGGVPGETTEVFDQVCALPWPYRAGVLTATFDKS
jgi:hypothetical protein